MVFYPKHKNYPLLSNWKSFVRMIGEKNLEYFATELSHRVTFIKNLVGKQVLSVNITAMQILNECYDIN